MTGAVGIGIVGLEQLADGLIAVGPEARAALRADLEASAEKVRSDASALALEKITRITPAWAEMRIGVTRQLTLVYVAPKKRGVKSRGPDSRKRPNLANLLADRATNPALEQNLPAIEARARGLLDRLTREFNR